MKNVYIGKLPKIVEKYNNVIHRAIEMKSVNVNQKACIISTIRFNTKNPELKTRCYVLRISQCRNIFLKSYRPNLTEEWFWIIEDRRP